MESSRAPTRQLLQRVLALSGICGLLFLVLLLVRLWQLQIVQHDELESRAIAQQLREAPTAAARVTRIVLHGTSGRFQLNTGAPSSSGATVTFRGATFGVASAGRNSTSARLPHTGQIRTYRAVPTVKLPLVVEYSTARVESPFLSGRIASTVFSFSAKLGVSEISTGMLFVRCSWPARATILTPPTPRASPRSSPIQSVAVLPS